VAPSWDLVARVALQARQILRDLDKVFRSLPRLPGGGVDKVSGPTCRSAGLLASRVHFTGTFETLVGGDPWVPMSLSQCLVNNASMVLGLSSCIAYECAPQFVLR
jgi:hypothetical protein